MKVKITLLEEMLGMSPGNKLIAEKFIASKAADANGTAEEIEAIPQVEDMRTVFPRDTDGCPIIWDYQMKGFFKDACGMLKRADDTKSSKMKAFKKEIDGLIFVTPRKIRIVLPEGKAIGLCERPLRASTPMGERICLASSETIPPGSTIEFEVKVLKDSIIPCIKEWFEYGKLRGLGQWRNSGFGRFEYVIES